MSHYRLSTSTNSRNRERVSSVGAEFPDLCRGEGEGEGGEKPEPPQDDQRAREGERERESSGAEAQVTIINRERYMIHKVQQERRT